MNYFDSSIRTLINNRKQVRHICTLFSWFQRPSLQSSVAIHRNTMSLSADAFRSPAFSEYGLM